MNTTFTTATTTATTTTSTLPTSGAALPYLDGARFITGQTLNVDGGYSLT